MANRLHRMLSAHLYFMRTHNIFSLGACEPIAAMESAPMVVTVIFENVALPNKVETLVPRYTPGTKASYQNRNKKGLLPSVFLGYV